MTTLSPYKIWWVEFVPDKGCVTRHDRAALGDALLLGKRSPFYRRPFPSKRAAVDFLINFRKRLDKRYTCYLFTDKQFTMANPETGYAIPYTAKQKNNPYYLLGNYPDKTFTKSH